MDREANQLESIFFAALEIYDSHSRADYLVQACGNNQELHARVERMLAAQSMGEHFLEHPPAVFAGTVGLDPKILDAGLSPAFGPERAVVIGPANHSVLKSLGETAPEKLPRVVLRDIKETGSDPIVRPHSREIPLEHADSRYQLAGEIARGGMGAIIKGRDVDLGRDLAIKVLLDAHKDKPDIVQRFIEEAQIGGQLQHPGIVPVYELGQFGDRRPFFSMKLVKGETLAALLAARKDSTQDQAKYLGIFEQVCQTMAYAHSRGVIHRDLKPANIMVGAFGEVQVMDWGLAKVLAAGGIADEKKSLDKQTEFSVIRTRRNTGSDAPGSRGSDAQTQIGSVMGTPAYMPPEQALGEVERLDERADVFGLGAILSEILTLKPPYIGSSGDEVFRLACRGKLDDCYGRLEQCNVDGALQAIVRDTLAPELVLRLRDAGQVAKRVTVYLQSVNSRMRQAEMERHDAVTRAEEARKRQRVSLALAASLLIGALVSGWLAVQAREQRDAAQRARLASEHSQRFAMLQTESAILASVKEVQQRLEAQRAQRLAETENERANQQASIASQSRKQSQRLLYASDMNLAQQSLLLNNLGKARRLLDRHRPQPGEEDLRGWEWRYLWQLTRSNAIATLTNRPSRGFSVSFSPDGSRLAVGWFDGQVDLWNVPDRQLVRTLTNSERPYRYPARVAFAPVRNLLAATTEQKKVTLYDLESGQESVLWQAPDRDWWDVRELAFSRDGSKIVVYAGSSVANGDAAWVIDVSSTNVERHVSTPYSYSSHFATARLSADKRHLFISRSEYLNRRYSIQCLDVATGDTVWQTEQLPDVGLAALDISPDGKVLASSSGFEDQTICIWDAATGRRIARLSGHNSWICKLAFANDGKQLMSAAADQSIRIWDTSNWTQIDVLRGHTDEVHAIAISEATQLVASASKDGDVMLWKPTGNDAANGYRRLSEDVQDFPAIPLNHSHVLSIPAKGSMQLNNLASDSMPQSLAEIGSSANFLGGFESDTLCTWNGLNQILVGKLHRTELVQTASITVDSGKRPNGIAYNESRLLLAWTELSTPPSIRVANIAAPERSFELKGDAAGLRHLRFSDDGKLLLAWNAEMNAWRVWDIDSRDIVRSIQMRAASAVFAAGMMYWISSAPCCSG